MPRETFAKLTRRAFASLLAGVSPAAASVATAEPRDVQTNPVPSVRVVGLFTQIPGLEVPEGIDVVETSGYAQLGLGAARYRVARVGPANNYRVQTANGRWFELCEPEPYVEMFGAVGNVPSRDDYRAVASAIAFNESRGGGVIRFDGSKTYFLSKTIAVDPTLTSIEAGGATLDFRLKEFLDFADQPELVMNGTFGSGASGWTFGPAGSNWSFRDGRAVHESASGDRGNVFGVFGQRIAAIQPDQDYVLTIVIDSASPRRDKRLLSVAIGDGLVEAGGNDARPDRQGVSIDQPGTHTVHIRTPATIAPGTGWLLFKSNASVVIASISLKLRPDNTCLLVRAKAAQYGQTRRYCMGLRIVGPARASKLADGIRFDTEANAFSSRWALYSCEFAINLGRGLVLGNRSYLLQAYSTWFSGSDACVETLTGTEDAGESIDFFSCTFGNGGIGIKNSGGMEIKLHGGSIDYCRQFFKGCGQTSLFGTHLEMAEPKSADQYPVELTGAGDFKMNGGTILIGSKGTNDFMFYGADPFSRVILKDVDAYGWPAAKGQLMGGAGRLMIDNLWWGANHRIVSVIKRDPIHSVFGSGGQFEGGAIAIGCAVSSPAGKNNGPFATRFDANNSVFAASLSLSKNYARSGSQSLKYIKTWGRGTATPIMIFAPIERRKMISCEFWYLCPRSLSGAAADTIWFDLDFAQFMGFDENRLPIVAQTARCQEIAVQIDQSTGMMDWVPMQLTSTYADHTSPTDGYAPDWATHMLISVNPINMAENFEMYFDNLYGFAF